MIENRFQPFRGRGESGKTHGNNKCRAKSLEINAPMSTGMSDHNLRNAINQCNKGYWNNEIDETIVNHSSVLTARPEMLQSSWDTCSGEQFPSRKKHEKYSLCSFLHGRLAEKKTKKTKRWLHKFTALTIRDRSLIKCYKQKFMIDITISEKIEKILALWVSANHRYIKMVSNYEVDTLILFNNVSETLWLMCC